MILTVFYLSFCCLVLFLVFILWYQNYSTRFKYLNQIPGPPGYPIIGHIPYLMLGQEKTFLFDRERAAKYFPIYKLWGLHIGAVSPMLPEDVEIILSNIKYVQKSKLYTLLEPWLGTGLLTGTDRKWQIRRKILTPAFHFTILQQFLSVFNRETTKLVAELEQYVQSPFVDIVQPITNFTLISILETSMGAELNTEATNKYKSAVYELGELLVYQMSKPWLHHPITFGLTSQGRRQKKLVKHLHSVSKSVIEKRKKNFEETCFSGRKKLAMLDLLLAAKANNNIDIDDEGIREEVDTFLFEGHDTTATAIYYILLTLANHKKIQDELYQEIIEVMGDTTETPTYNILQELTFMERCIKECLRLYPSVPFIAREAPENIKLASGYVIPKGCMINVYIYDIHRNPSIFPDPEKFDPDRFLPENIKNRHPYAYIPFSAGHRNCIGQRFALLEIKTVLCGILKKFELEPVDKPTDLVILADLVLRSKNGIKIRLKLREPT